MDANDLERTYKNRALAELMVRVHLEQLTVRKSGTRNDRLYNDYLQSLYRCFTAAWRSQGNITDPVTLKHDWDETLSTVRSRRQRKLKNKVEAYARLLAGDFERVANNLHRTAFEAIPLTTVS